MVHPPRARRRVCTVGCSALVHTNDDNVERDPLPERGGQVSVVRTHVALSNVHQSWRDATYNDLNNHIRHAILRVAAGECSPKERDHADSVHHTSIKDNTDRAGEAVGVQNGGCYL